METKYDVYAGKKGRGRGLCSLECSFTLLEKAQLYAKIKSVNSALVYDVRGSDKICTPHGAYKNGVKIKT